jgi:hypothetical protein
LPSCAEAGISAAASTSAAIAIARPTIDASLEVNVPMMALLRPAGNRRAL